MWCAMFSFIFMGIEDRDNGGTCRQRPRDGDCSWPECALVVIIPKMLLLNKVSENRIFVSVTITITSLDHNRHH